MIPGGAEMRPCRPREEGALWLPGFNLLGAPGKGPLPVLPTGQCKSTERVHPSCALFPGMWGWPVRSLRNALDLPCTNSLQATLGHSFWQSSCGERLQDKREDSPAVPEPTHTKDLLRVHCCHLDLVESVGG